MPRIGSNGDEMKPGDLVQIRGDTAPMYPDHVRHNWNAPYKHAGYARNGSTGIFLESERVSSGNLEVTFHRILMSEIGPVWVRGAWVHKISS